MTRAVGGQITARVILDVSSSTLGGVDALKNAEPRGITANAGKPYIGHT